MAWLNDGGRHDNSHRANQDEVPPRASHSNRRLSAVRHWSVTHRSRISGQLGRSERLLKTEVRVRPAFYSCSGCGNLRQRRSYENQDVGVDLCPFASNHAGNLVPDRRAPFPQAQKAITQSREQSPAIADRASLFVAPES
jgi:hypothetical protein